MFCSEGLIRWAGVTTVYISFCLNSLCLTGCLQVLAIVLCLGGKILLLFLTVLEVLVLRSWGLGGEQGFAGISVAWVVQLPLLVLQAQKQRYLLVWDALHLMPYL